MKNRRNAQRQQRIAERRNNSRRAARVTHPADAGIAMGIEDLPGWRLAVMRHSHRDPRVLGREDEAAEYVRGLPRPYTCGGCNGTPSLMLAGVLDSPGLDQLGLRCLACRNGPHGLYADLALLGTREALTDELLRMIVKGVAQRVASDKEVMAADASWFARNPGRQTRLRQPMNAMERGTCAAPAAGMQLLVLVRRDGSAWRTPESMWAPVDWLQLDAKDTPAAIANAPNNLDCEFMDAVNEALFDLAREKPGAVEYAEIAQRAMERHHASRQAAEAARAAAQPRDEGGAA